MLNLRDKVTFVGPCRGNAKKKSEACAKTCSGPITRTTASLEFNCQKLLDSVHNTSCEIHISITVVKLSSLLNLTEKYNCTLLHVAVEKDELLSN